MRDVEDEPGPVGARPVASRVEQRRRLLRR
jgi:hypothetical protein